MSQNNARSLIHLAWTALLPVIAGVFAFYRHSLQVVVD
jgi:hypothetical protein